MIPWLGTNIALFKGFPILMWQWCDLVIPGPLSWSSEDSPGRILAIAFPVSPRQYHQRYEGILAVDVFQYPFEIAV